MGADRPPSDAPFEERLAFETLLADISARLLAAPLEDVDAVVEGALHDVRVFFRADRCGLLAASADQHVLRVTHASYAEGAHLDIKDIDLAKLFPWTFQKLVVERTPFRASRLADLPPEAAKDRIGRKQFSVGSNLSIPIPVGSALGHVIIIQTMHEGREWPDAYIPRLRLLAEMLVNALERKRTHDALQLSRARLELAAASAGAGLWEIDLPKGRIWATLEFRRLHGEGPAETRTIERFLTIVHPDDRDRVARAIEASVRNRDRFEQQYRIVRPDGAERWMHTRGRPEGPDRLFGVSVDVTERVRAAELAERQEARLAAAVEVAEVGFSELRGSADRPFFDERLRDMLGLGPGNEDQDRDFWLAHVHKDDKEEVLEQRRQLLNGDADRMAIEYRYEHPTRGTIWLRQTARALTDKAEKESQRIVGTVQDVTDRKRLEQELRHALDEAQELRDRLQQENVYLRRETRPRYDTDLVVGRSAALRHVLALAEQVAATNSTVLLLGETGTGKERFASLIHEASQRRGRAMIRVNCSAIPSALIESELFGREKGAYTGALTKQIGRFELAHGSTLFLDEIGDLPAEVQVKLLRVLEERTIERLGSPRPVTVDVRIIAATHRDLERAAQAGTFRQDLYYRLNVFPITVPPLRERPDDIPLLVNAFVDEFAAAMDKPISTVDPASLAALAAYAWPGNVRELRNVVERAMILASGPTLVLEPPVPATPVPEAPSDLNALERAHILQVLQDSGWRVRGKHGAAERLGLRPTTLEARMKKLDIQRPGSTQRP